MALVVKDRVKETSTITGTGTLTLAGAADNFQSFSVIGDGNTTYYAIVDIATGDWEVGLGTYTASGTTLSRDTVLESSNSGSLVSFAGNTVEVFCTYPAEKAIVADGSGLTTLPDGLVVAGNLTVQGTTTTIEATNLAIADNMVYLRDGETTGNVDLGFAGNYNDGTYAHAGFFRDATDGRWKVFDSYTPEPDAATDINTSHASFALADIQASNFYGNLTGNVTGNVTGTVSGNAGTATKLATARSIGLGGDLSGSANFDGSANITITAAVADDSHNHTIANVDGLQTALDTKLDSSTGLTTSTSFGGDVSGTYNAIVVADDSHNHVISNVDGLQTALDAKVDLSGDTMTGDLNFANDVQAAFGASSNLTLEYNSTNTANFLTSSNTLYFKTDANETMAVFTPNAECALYYNNAPKLEVTSVGATVFGNISVTGTVDGRDVASDGSKLDGIESGATADQTAAEILTAIKTVDGAGSGLDADTLDGQQGSYYYPASNPNGYITSYVNTTYSAGSGLDLTGTTFSVESDLSGEVNKIGYSGTDYLIVGDTTIDFYLDGNMDMRLENDGDLHVDGDVIAYSTTTSDPRLKENVQKVEGALDMIDKLNGYTFTYKVDGRESAGVMSTEVKEVLPSAVRSTTLPLKSPNGQDDTTEYDVVQYDQLHAVLIEAIKELKAEIEVLKGAK